MADVSKLTINDDEYDLKDAVARADIATAQDDIAQAQDDITTLEGNVATLDDSKVSKSGDTMTGNLVINGPMGVVGLGINPSEDSARGAKIVFSKGTDTKRVYVYQYKDNDINYDLFKFPATTNSETSNGIYALLSTKNVVTTEQGGTGGTDSGWQSFTNASVFTGTIYYRKIGIFATVTFSGLTLKSQTSSGNIDLGILTYAAGMTPSHLMTFPARIYTTGTDNYASILTIYSTGSNGAAIRIYKNPSIATLATTATLHATAFYVI